MHNFAQKGALSCPLVPLSARQPAGLYLADPGRCLPGIDNPGKKKGVLFTVKARMQWPRARNLGICFNFFENAPALDIIFFQVRKLLKRCMNELRHVFLKRQRILRS